jgi:hypothetical protein
MDISNHPVFITLMSYMRSWIKKYCFRINTKKGADSKANNRNATTLCESRNPGL